MPFYDFVCDACDTKHPDVFMKMSEIETAEIICNCGTKMRREFGAEFRHS